MFPSDYNFSHRINHFSFGEPLPGLVSPLDGDERIVHDSKLKFIDKIEVYVCFMNVTTLFAYDFDLKCIHEVIKGIIFLSKTTNYIDVDDVFSILDPLI